MSATTGHPSIATTSSATETPIAHWLRNALVTSVFSAAIGLALTLLEPSLYGLIENLVYSLCIGFSIHAAFTLFGRWLVPGGDTHPLLHFMLRGVVGVPLGLFVGLNLAAAFLGNPGGLAVFNHAAIFALPITIVASVAIMYFLWSRKRLADVAAANAQAQRMMAETQLRLLQAQIEPHMLFNTLANLRTLVEVDALRAQAMIDQLIVYLRGTLAASRASTTTLEHEFAQLAAYLDLMKVRMASRLTVAFDLPPDLAGHSIPPMLLQPLVENAIKHGLEPKIAGGIVRVTASSMGDRLQIDVCDDGVGLADSIDDTRYGLEHVRERLRTLYGDAATLVVEPRDAGGVRARVVLPR